MATEYGPVRMVAFWHVLLPFGAVSISVVAQMNRRIMGLIMTARSGPRVGSGRPDETHYATISWAYPKSTIRACT